MIIGAHDGKVFAACSGERPGSDRVYDAIRKILGGFQSGELKRDSQHIRQNHVLTENGSIARMYAKTGMNALAHLRGYEYAAHPAFDGSGGGSRAGKMTRGSTTCQASPPKEAGLHMRFPKMRISACLCRLRAKYARLSALRQVYAPVHWGAPAAEISGILRHTYATEEQG